MKIPIVSGIYADTDADFRTSYPINLRPVPKTQGISEGYLRIVDGVTQNGTAPGITRGGIEWFGDCYRVCGDDVVAVDRNGLTTTLGTVASGGTASMTYSFDRLAVASGGKLYLWDKASLVEVTDPDLGVALDVVWVDGYFVTTDGENIVVTELNDPTSVDPLKYGSSEVDPDPVKRVMKLRNELYTVNRHTIETFQNVGGTGFPFQVIRGAQIQRGAIGTHCAVALRDTVAFLGGGRNESPGVFIGVNGTSDRISTREIDEVLMTYTEEQLQDAFLEVQQEKNHEILMVHLPSETWCYDLAASGALGMPIWYKLAGGELMDEAYPARHLVWAYDKWLVGSQLDTRLGFLNSSDFDLWDDQSYWQFGVPVVYNDSHGALFHELELVSLTGATSAALNGQIYTQYSLDGVEWSQRRYVDYGQPGAREKRFRWFRNGKMSNYRMQRFGGTSRSPVSVARLEAELEPLAW